MLLTPREFAIRFGHSRASSRRERDKGRSKKMRSQIEEADFSENPENSTRFGIEEWKNENGGAAGDKRGANILIPRQ